MIIDLVYDPIKDDSYWYPTLVAGQNRTVESYCYDIYDFGATDQKAMNAGKQNITMVTEPSAEEYWHTSNVYDFTTGSIKDGSNATSPNKNCIIHRETNGSLCIWDTTRIGRVELMA